MTRFLFLVVDSADGTGLDGVARPGEKNGASLDNGEGTRVEPALARGACELRAEERGPTFDPGEFGFWGEDVLASGEVMWPPRVSDGGAPGSSPSWSRSTAGAGNLEGSVSPE